MAMSIEFLIKLILGIFVLVMIVIGITFVFKNYIFPYFEIFGVLLK